MSCLPPALNNEHEMTAQQHGLASVPHPASVSRPHPEFVQRSSKTRELPFQILRPRGATGKCARGLARMTDPQNWPRTGSCSPCHPVISSTCCRSSPAFPAGANRSSPTPIVRSTTSISLTAGSCRWWRFIQTAASSRWQRSGGRVAQECKPSSVPNFLCSVLRSDSGKRRTDVPCSVRPRHALNALISPSGVCVRPSLSRAGHGVGRVQWRA